MRTARSVTLFRLPRCRPYFDMLALYRQREEIRRIRFVTHVEVLLASNEPGEWSFREVVELSVEHVMCALLERPDALPHSSTVRRAAYALMQEADNYWRTYTFNGRHAPHISRKTYNTARRAYSAGIGWAAAIGMLATEEKRALHFPSAA